MGGLVANWEKMYKRSKPAASTTSLATSGAGDNTDELLTQATGEFAKDEDVDMINTARQAKDTMRDQGKKAGSKKTVKLDKVHADTIDEQELIVISRSPLW